MIRGIIFDLDGVLTHTSEEHFLAWKALAKELGHELPEKVKDQVRGISRLDSLEVVLKAIGRSDDFTNQEKIELATHKNNLYLESIAQFSSENLVEGAKDLLKELHKLGVRIGLASASRSGAMLLTRLGIEEYFMTVVDPAKVIQGKPHPEVFLRAAEQLRLEPQECLGVEDAAAGIVSIQAAGMKAIGIGTTEVKAADYRFETLAEASPWLLNYLKEQIYGKC